MGAFSQQIGAPASGGKFDSLQNKITTPTTSGQQQFGMPMQQSTGMVGDGQQQFQRFAESAQQQLGTQPLGQSLTSSQGIAYPQASPQITQSPQLDQSAATGQNAYPNTIGSMDNTQNQPIPASMQAGKGKGA